MKKAIIIVVGLALLSSLVFAGKNIKLFRSLHAASDISDQPGIINQDFTTLINCVGIKHRSLDKQCVAAGSHTTGIPRWRWNWQATCPWGASLGRDFTGARTTSTTATPSFIMQSFTVPAGNISRTGQHAFDGSGEKNGGHGKGILGGAGPLAHNAS